MDRSGKLVQAELVDTLAIAKLGSQGFPEIEPLFVRTHIADLGKTWRILNNEGIHHDIVFNENEDVPLVVSGWTELQEYYALPNDVAVVVGYYENNKFEVVGFKEITAFEELPTFHSRFIYQEGIYAFDVDLSPISVSTPKLKLQPEFGCVLRDNDYEVLTLCGDNDYEVLTLCGDNGRTQMLLILNIHDSHRTKIGYEWDAFCESNHLRAGDRIRFRLDVTDANKTCHVYKVRYP